MANVQPYLARLTAKREADGWRWHQFRFSFALVEKAVQLELERQPALEKLYHKRADFIYEEYDVSDRQQEFQKLDWSFFCRLGVPERIGSLVEKFPIIGTHADSIVVYLAAHEGEQTADLFIKNGVKHVLISVRPEMFVNWDRSRKYLVHELMYVADMLDPSFAYEKRSLGTSVIDEEIVRQRFALLWRINISGRLDQHGETPILALDSYEDEFNRLFRRIPSDQRNGILNQLWSANTLTYQHLVGFARDLSYLATWAGTPVELTSDLSSLLTQRSFCPICNCRMYRAAQLDKGSGSVILDRIQREFPDWSPDQGICDRCLEYCELQ